MPKKSPYDPKKSLPYEKQYWRQENDVIVELCYCTTERVSSHLEFDKRDWFKINCVEKLLQEAGYTRID